MKPLEEINRLKEIYFVSFAAIGTYVSTLYHKEFVLLQKPGEVLAERTPVRVVFCCPCKHSGGGVTIHYSDGYTYVGGIAVDLLQGFMAHGQGRIQRPRESFWMCGYFQGGGVYGKRLSVVDVDDENDPAPKLEKCENPMCVNSTNTRFFTLSAMPPLPLLCEKCSLNEVVTEGSVNVLKKEFMVSLLPANYPVTRRLEDLLVKQFRTNMEVDDSEEGDLAVYRQFSCWDYYKRAAFFDKLYKAHSIHERTLQDFKDSLVKEQAIAKNEEEEL